MRTRASVGRPSGPVSSPVIRLTRWALRAGVVRVAARPVRSRCARTERNTRAYSAVGAFVRGDSSSLPPHRLRTSALSAVSPAVATVGALLVVTAGVALGTAPPASADAAPLLNIALLAGGAPEGTQSQGLFAATQAQETSLGNLEGQAVEDTVADHALDNPGTSAADTAAAAQTWGRDASEIELWGLVVQAIQTPAASRSTDQANVVAWLEDVVTRERVIEAQDAALEYVKWAGLGVSNYESLLASNPSESALESFLSQTPNNYGAGFSVNSPKSTSNEGYCDYVSPTQDTKNVYAENIYHGTWSNSASESCYAPCSGQAGCNPDPPPIATLIEWGIYDSLVPLVSQQSTSDTLLGMSKQFAFAAAATLGAPLPRGPGAGPAFSVGSSVSGELTAFNTSAYPVEVGAGADAGVDVAEKAIGAINVVADEIPVVGEITSLVSIFIEFYNFTVTDSVPYNLATAITAAPAGYLSLTLDDDPGLLYGLFAAATGPTPQVTACDANAVLDPTATPCLNAPPALDKSAAMPVTVTPQGGASSSATTVAWTDSAAKINNSAYFVGDWAVDTATTAQGTTPYQTLDINYTDWNGKEQTAWLVPSGSAGYQFLTAQVTANGFDPSTCGNSGLCKLTDSLQMVDTTGNDFTLGVNFGNGVPALPADGCGVRICLDPELTETASPAVGEVGQPITLTASMLASAGLGTATFVEDVAGKDTTLCQDVPLVALNQTFSCSWTPTAPVDDAQIYATFAGTSGIASDQASVQVQVSTKAATTTTLIASAPTLALGAPITYTATVADLYPGDAAVPGGTVDFSSDTDSEGAVSNLCTDVPILAGPGGMTATCPTTLTGAGTQTVMARFVGDAATSPSTGSTQTTVPPGPTVIDLDAASGLTVGTQTSITVTLSAAGVPSSAFMGAIQILSTDGGRCVTGNGEDASVTDGSATCQYTPSATGTVTLSVTFESVVPVFPPPRIAYGPLGSQTTVTANVAPASPAIATSQDPAATTVGGSIADQATVSGGDSPTGTVTFSLYSNPNATGTPLLSDTEPLSNGSATSKGYTTKTTGTDYWVATYNGDANNTPVSSGNGAELVRVAPASPAIATSQQPAATTVGGSIADQATVSGGDSPTGTVTFSLYSNPNATGTPLLSDTEPLSNGSATSKGYTTKTTGTDYWVATYNGDANNTPVSSGNGAELVRVAPASPAIATSQQPAATTVGGSIADQATVSGGDSPTGTVTFSLYSNPNATGTPLLSDTEPLSNGSATSKGYTTKTHRDRLLGRDLQRRRQQHPGEQR